MKIGEAEVKIGEAEVKIGEAEVKIGRPKMEYLGGRKLSKNQDPRPSQRIMRPGIHALCAHSRMCTPMNIINQRSRPILTYAESFVKIRLHLAEISQFASVQM